MHTHSRHGVAVSMQKHGLLPSSQKALTIMGWVGYHDFEGTATAAPDEQPRTVRRVLGDRRLAAILAATTALPCRSDRPWATGIRVDLPAGDRLPPP